LLTVLHQQTSKQILLLVALMDKTCTTNDPECVAIKQGQIKYRGY